MQTVDWNSVRKTFLPTLLGFAALAAAASFYFWGVNGAVVSFVAAFYLLAGFWLTENLVGLMTRVKTVSPVGVIFLFTAKLLWWGSLFLLMRKARPEWQLPIAVGIGAFLFALLAAVLSHSWMPKVSDAAGESKP